MGLYFTNDFTNVKGNVRRIAVVNRISSIVPLSLVAPLSSVASLRLVAFSAIIYGGTD